MNPWVLTGICLLLLFFGSYLTALSWADLTYVLPATALSYVLMALLAKLFLNEHVTASRWLGIALISAGVGFVASGPSVTPAVHPHREQPESETPVGQQRKERCMTGAATWAGIAAIVVTATTGDVLQARAMKEIGDLGVIRKSQGILEVARRDPHQPAVHVRDCSLWRWLFSACWSRCRGTM